MTLCAMPKKEEYDVGGGCEERLLDEENSYLVCDRVQSTTMCHPGENRRI